VEQELLTLQEHLGSPSFILWEPLICCFLCLFSLIIVLLSIFIFDFILIMSWDLMSFPAVGYSTGRTPPNFVKLDSIGSIVNTIKKKKNKNKKNYDR